MNAECGHTSSVSNRQNLRPLDNSLHGASSAELSPSLNKKLHRLRLDSVEKRCQPEPSLHGQRSESRTVRVESLEPVKILFSISYIVRGSALASR